jgi:hypothetical protein
VNVLENGCQFGDISETISSVLGKMGEGLYTNKRSRENVGLVLDKIKIRITEKIDKIIQ